MRYQDLTTDQTIEEAAVCLDAAVGAVGEDNNAAAMLFRESIAASLIVIAKSCEKLSSRGIRAYVVEVPEDAV